MQPDERVGVEPEPARPVAMVDHDDPGVGLRQQCVDERHRRGSSTDDEMGGLDLTHGGPRSRRRPFGR
jgi:hypothetical protein